MATDDLVARLRYGQGQDWDMPYATREEAAATIEALRSELAARDAEIAVWLRSLPKWQNISPDHVSAWTPGILADAIASGQYRKGHP
jgi:hypothetical protein